MSRDLYVCMIDLEKFKSVAGSGDRELLERVLHDRQDLIAAHDEDYRESWPLESYTPLSVALGQIITGTIDPGLTPRFQFEHAVALLADALGEPLETIAFLETRAPFWEEINRVIRQRSRAARLPDSDWPTLDELLERGPLLEVPIDPSLRLGTGYLTGGEIERAAAAVACVDLESTEGLDNLTWPEEALEAAEEYRGWLREAASRRLGLFFHC